MRRLSRGRAVLGGSPTRLLRLTDAGAELVASLAAGDDIRSSRGVDALVSRLVDAGVVHPQPGAHDGPFGAGDVTVVVPVRDRSDGLVRLLESLTAAGTGAVIVVDDGSTEPVVLDGCTVLRRDRPGGPAAARNAGASRADTALVAFVDSDCVVEPGWLDPLLGHFADPQVAAVAPRIRSIAPSRGATVLERYERRRSPLDLGDEPARVEPGTRVSYVPSAALVLRADVLDRIGGFDEGLRVGEDVDLVWRLVEHGHRVRYEPRSTVHHEVRPHLRSWLTQRFGYGTSAAALEARHPGAVAPVVASPWSFALWGLVVLGHPAAAASLGAGTVAAMTRKVPDLPASEVLRLAVGGHLGAARQLARTVLRVWWPAAAVASLVSRRVRRVVAAAVLVSIVDAWADDARHGETGGVLSRDLVRFGALVLLDDLAYGVGVWAGCRRQRSIRALLPGTGGAS